MYKPTVIPYVFLYVADLPRARDFYESALGLRVLEDDAGAVKYDTGDVILALNRAADHGLRLEADRDDSVMIVFHTTDLEADRGELERRGVTLGGTLRYEIGATASFYDPDGHCLCLYEPSEEAMTWPSAKKINEVLRGGQGQAANGAGVGLGRSKIIYVFLFVNDLDQTYAFYHDQLGLSVLEADRAAGVVKYDAGGLILATHLVGGDAACAVDMKLSHAKSVSFAIYAPDIEKAYAALGRRRLTFEGSILQGSIGATAKFTDSDGHPFYLYSPSAEALSWASGPRVQELVSRYGSAPG